MLISNLIRLNTYIHSLLFKRRIGFETPMQWEFRQCHTQQGGFSESAADVSSSSGSQNNCSCHSQGTLLCYINSLPIELLAQIFELSIITRGGLSPYSIHAHLCRISYEDAPLKLLSVCKLWKSVALATHSLWDAVCPSQNSVTFMKKWIKNAPKIPFHFKLNIPSGSDYYHSHALKMFLLFSTTTHRWKSFELQLELTALGFTTELTRLIREVTQNLQVPLHFLVTIYRGGYNWGIEQIFSALPSTTPIERFRWRHCSRLPLEARPFFKRVPGNLKGIKILEISHPALTAEFVGYLMQCDAATTVKFVQPSSRLGPVPLLVPFGLPHRHECLTSLSLSSRTSPMSILERFTFPSLRKLCIGIADRDRSAFNSFLTRTFDLETLLIHENDVDDYSLRYYFTSTAMRRVPNVRVTCKYASKRAARTVKKDLQLFHSLPALVCWRQTYDDNPERLRDKGSADLAVFVGWGEGSTNVSGRIWSFHHGVLEFRNKAVILV